MLNCRVVWARPSFQIFRQNTWFLENNRALQKFLYGFLGFWNNYFQERPLSKVLPWAQNVDWMYVRHSNDVLNTNAEVFFQLSCLHFGKGPHYVLWTSSCAFNLRPTSKGRFDPDPKSEVLLKIAVLKIQEILRSISTVKSFTENADNPKLFYWSWTST